MSPSPPRIRIPKQGIIEGALDEQKGVVRFLNVPYATVHERWRPASKPDPWEGVRDATKQGPVPHQPTSETRFSKAINTYSEHDFDDATTHFDEKHCLNLNIYVSWDSLQKGQCAPQRAAVMVYLHGGGFRDGANAMDLYDGVNLVAESVIIGRPVIVVVPNYRLNFFGFFSCPELVEDVRSDPKLQPGYEHSTGNWGLMDQKLALEWVRQNIGMFGGQADNITAYGESVGGVSVNYHMLISQHRGLFERGIIQSCAMASAPAIRPEMEGRLYFDYLTDYFNIPKELARKEKLEILKNVPASELGQAANSPKLRMFTPFIDGIVIPEDVRKWVHRTEHYDPGVKAVIVGDMKDDGSLFVGSLASLTREGWGRVFEKYCPPDPQSRQAWEAVYGAVTTDEDAVYASRKVVDHSIFVYPEFSTLRALSMRPDLGQGFDLYQYYFERPLHAVINKEGGANKNLGAHHGNDLVFLFAPDFAQEKVFTKDEKALSRQMQRMWIEFAHGEGASWPARITQRVDNFAYHGQVEEAVIFQDDATVTKGHASRAGKALLSLWEASETWVSAAREQQGTGGLKAGLLCIAIPPAESWS
ncbi:hypothetical protein CPC16_007101 [Podila verticillata]|nr:hypothetical protein CPC16_007101 [Podila verticillata]KAI9239791.1 MAG: Alpha/Beta hydrolase protein [Podila humilis]